MGSKCQFCLVKCRTGGKADEWCRYQVADVDGSLSADVVIDVQSTQMMHDFAISENYAVFLDAALVFDPSEMAKTGGLPFVTRTDKPSRIGLVRLAAPQEGVFKWFEVPPFTCFHTANAWEEDDGAVCVALCRCTPGPLAPLPPCTLAPFPTCALAYLCPCPLVPLPTCPLAHLPKGQVALHLATQRCTQARTPAQQEVTRGGLECSNDRVDMNAKDGVALINGPHLVRYNLHPDGTTTMTQLLAPEGAATAPARCEFPVVAPQRLGRRQRFTYAVEIDNEGANSTGTLFYECALSIYYLKDCVLKKTSGQPST